MQAGSIREGETETFYVLKNVFRDELCAGYDAREIATELRQRGQLIAEKVSLTAKVRVYGEEHPLRLVVINVAQDTRDV